MGVGTSGTAAAAAVAVKREEGVKNEVMVDWEVRFCRLRGVDGVDILLML